MIAESRLFQSIFFVEALAHDAHQLWRILASQLYRFRGRAIHPLIELLGLGEENRMRSWLIVATSGWGVVVRNE